MVTPAMVMSATSFPRTGKFREFPGSGRHRTGKDPGFGGLGGGLRGVRAPARAFGLGETGGGDAGDTARRRGLGGLVGLVMEMLTLPDSCFLLLPCRPVTLSPVPGPSGTRGVPGIPWALGGHVRVRV